MNGVREAFLAGVRRGTSDGMEGYPEIADDYLAAHQVADWVRDAVLAHNPFVGWDTVYCYWCGNAEWEAHAPECVYARLSASGS